MADPIVVDLSHYQPTPDWQKLKAAGVVGVILKCTDGAGYVDPTFASRYDAAIAAGLAVSTYHFLRPGNIQTQMNFYLNTLKPRNGERLCLDHEDAGVTLKELEQAVAYLQTDSRDIQVTVYSGHLIKDQLRDGYSDVLAMTSLWIAQYTSANAPSWPIGTWPDWTLWQYTDKATVSGISGPVDGNKFNGSAENCGKWLGPATSGPAPEPAEDLSLVVALSQPGAPPPKSIKVSVTWNGEIMVAP